MKTTSLLALLVLSTVSVTVAEDPLLVTGGHRFRTAEGDFVPNTGILIEDGRFKSVDATNVASDVNRLKLSDGQFILPGLIDLHAHYNVKLLKIRREEFNVMPTVYLANGVTVTFSAGEYDPEGMLQLRKRIESGEQIGPRLLNSGPYFGFARRGWRNITDEQIREDVDTWAERGVGGFKAKGINAQHLKVLVDRAHKHGLTVTGHLGSGYRGMINPRDAVKIGIDRVEHFLGGDAMPASKPAYDSLAGITADMPEFKKQVQLFIEKGAYYDCTLTAYGYFGKRGEEYDYWVDEREFFTPYIQKIVADRKPPLMMKFDAIYRAKLKTIAAYHKAGGKITTGTDHFSSGEFLPGFGFHRELDALSRAGIPNADVLRIGTINGATAMKLEADHGSIAVGKVADLCIIEGDPLKNIRNTRNVTKVVRAGVVHDSKQLLESVRGKLGPKDESEASRW